MKRFPSYTEVFVTYQNIRETARWTTISSLVTTSSLKYLMKEAGSVLGSPWNLGG